MIQSLLIYADRLEKHKIGQYTIFVVYFSIINISLQGFKTVKTEKKRYIFKEFSIFFLALTILVCMLVCVACGSSFQETVTTFACDTVISLTYYDKKDKEAVEGALSYLSDLELIFSRTNKNSELYALNEALKEGKEYLASDELFKALTLAYEEAEKSGGAFDFTLGKVSDLWDFTGQEPHVPASDILSETLSHTGYKKIHLEELFAFDDDSSHKGYVYSDDPGLSVDLGGMAKGYMGQKLKEYLIDAGVESALLNLGGNVITIGHKPDGQAFQIGISKPEKGSTEFVAVVEASGESVVTSGIYQRCFEESGKWYHHILDSKTGWPVDSDAASVTVVCNDSGLADILSTTLFVKGWNCAQDYIKSRTESIKVIYVMKDGSLKEYSNK